MRLIIDGDYLSYRSFSAPYKLTTSTKLDSTLVHTLFKSLFKLEREHNPSEVIFTWEGGGLSWRRQLLKTYKPPKQKDPQHITQLADVKKILQHLGYKQYFSLRNEADDCIATLVTQEEQPTNIFTVDKDIMQLISDTIPIQVICKDKIFNKQSVIDKFGVTPYQLPDFLALTGDSSDNIKGVQGIGPKSASKLLHKYKSLDHVPLTRENRELVNLNRKLIKLNRRATLCDVSPSPITLDEYLNKYELKELKKRLL